MKPCMLLLGLAVLLPLPSQATQADQVKASQAWIRLLPAHLPAGGYVTLDNRSSSVATLVCLDSPAYASIMLHRSSTDATGTTTMHKLDRLTIAPHAVIALASAGYHLMLKEAKRPLKPGDTIAVTLHFADGSQLRVPFLTRPANASD